MPFSIDRSLSVPFFFLLFLFCPVFVLVWRERGREGRKVDYSWYITRYFSKRSSHAGQGGRVNVGANYLHTSFPLSFYFSLWGGEGKGNRTRRAKKREFGHHSNSTRFFILSIRKVASGRMPYLHMHGGGQRLVPGSWSCVLAVA